MSTTPLVSIVTPAYNEEDYLAECIESVLAQTYTHWNYTIINNCSDDHTLSIADEYAARDARIRVVDNTSFLSQIDNLNHALSLISQDCAYAKMVLADDMIYPRCLEEMVRVGEANPTVGLITAHRMDDQVVNCDGLALPDECFDGRDVGRATLLDDLFVFGSPTTIMLRSSLVRACQPFYNPNALHEDTESCLEILREHDLGYVHEVLSFTRRENESITTARRAFDPAHRLDRLVMGANCGPMFLSAEEQRCRQARLENAYYRFLGERILYRTPVGFWAYHRSGLRGGRTRLHRRQLLVAVLRAALAELKHPRQLGRRLTKLLLGRRD
jgi:glycosyltransferase involved in cell wall biosynthesis